MGPLFSRVVFLCVVLLSFGGGSRACGLAIENNYSPLVNQEGKEMETDEGVEFSPLEEGGVLLPRGRFLEPSGRDIEYTDDNDGQPLQENFPDDFEKDHGVVVFDSEEGQTPENLNAHRHLTGCGAVTVSGCEDVQLNSMTTYFLQPDTCDGRPLYKASNGYWLYYSNSNTDWLISNYGCGSISAVVYNNDLSATEPFDALQSSWKCNTDGSWVQYDLEVDCNQCSSACAAGSGW